MPESFSASEPLAPSAAEVMERQAEVAAERQLACAELATECTDTLNETPEGRLQLVCAEEGLSLDGVEPTEVFNNRHLQVAFSRPLPMTASMRERCVALLRSTLAEEEAPPAEVSAQEAEREAALAVEIEGAAIAADLVEAEAVEVRVIAAAEEAGSAEVRAITVEEEAGREAVDTSAAAVENLIRSQVSAGNIDHYEAETARLLAGQYEGEALANAQAAAERFFAPHRENLNAMQAIFTPQEVQQVFGGSLTSTVSLNLAAQSNADIYRDLFTRIDAGFAGDDDRRREVRAQVEAQLGIQLREVERPNNATELQASLREGRGTERVQVGTETVEEPPGSGNWVEQPIYEDQVIPFTPQDKLMLSTNPAVGLYPDPPGSTNYRVEGEVTGADPIRFEVDIPANGAIPEAYINREFNKALITANFHNSGLRGAMEFLATGVDATVPMSTDTGRSAIGQNDVLQKVFEVFHGVNFPLEGRFATQAELQSSQNDLRWLAIDGDLGPTNQINPALSVSLMRAVFGNSQDEITGSLSRAQSVINTGGAEAPSIQRLYQALHPDDAANGYPRLRSIIGDQGMALLELS